MMVPWWAQPRVWVIDDTHKIKNTPEEAYIQRNGWRISLHEEGTHAVIVSGDNTQTFRINYELSDDDVRSFIHRVEERHGKKLVYMAEHKRKLALKNHKEENPIAYRSIKVLSQYEFLVWYAGKGWPEHIV